MAVVFLAGLHHYLGADINHDSAWFLDATARWLDGARLYVDIFETNPPLAFYLTAPVIWISRATGLFAPQIFVFHVFVLMAVSLGLTRRLLLGARGLPPALAHVIVAAAALVFVAGPLRDFGQREHLATMLALPYFVLLGLRVLGRDPEGGRGRALAVLVGFAAALGFCLKPYFLLAPVGAELYLLARTRGRGGLFRRLARPESITLAAGALLYAASIPVFAPAYLSELLPVGYAVFQAGYGAPLASVLFAARVPLVALMLALGLRATARIPAPFAAFADLFLIWALAFVAALLMQMKGWSYHFYPVLAGTVLAAAAILAGLVAAAPAETGPADGSRRARRAAAAWAVLVIALPFAGAALNHASYGNFARTAAPTVRRHAAGSAIYVFASNVSATYPLVTYAGVRSASRFSTMWPLPGLMRRRHAGDSDGDAMLDRIERFIRDSVVADFSHDPPALVLVDDRRRKSYFAELDFDYIAFFLRGPRFAEIWAEYREIGRIGDFRAFERR